LVSGDFGLKHTGGIALQEFGADVGFSFALFSTDE
jgi:hypothetical protein